MKKIHKYRFEWLLELVREAGASKFPIIYHHDDITVMISHAEGEKPGTAVITAFTDDGRPLPKSSIDN